MKEWPNKTCAWLALYLTEGLGNIAIKNLFEEFGDPAAIFKASIKELRRVEGVGERCARNIVNGQFAGDPMEELRKVERHGGWILTYDAPSYPALLREIHDPPMILYAAGKEIPTDQILIAVVGSRSATYYGLNAAQKIGFGLARRGIGVVSGLARGVDSAAHWGCLKGDGFTVAVLGTGIDVTYPATNKKLMEQVRKRSVVLSEFPMGTPPEARNFPIRNRIISGLCKGVVVVEATKKSGSLITASLALDQGREVFAVPGSIDSFKSMGTHSLIKQGAKLIENADDIVEEIGFHHASDTVDHVKAPVVFPLPPMDASERRIYEMIEDYPVHIDHIVRQLGIEAGQVLSTLLRMELKGIIKQLPGKMFVR